MCLAPTQACPVTLGRSSALSGLYPGVSHPTAHLLAAGTLSRTAPRSPLPAEDSKQGLLVLADALGQQQGPRPPLL